MLFFCLIVIPMLLFLSAGNSDGSHEEGIGQPHQGVEESDSSEDEVSFVFLTIFFDTKLFY